MGQFISFKSEIDNPWFNPWFILLHTHSNVCATVEGRCKSTWYTVAGGVPNYSRVQKSWNEVFFKILKKPSIVQKKMIPHMNGLLVFLEVKQKKIQMAASKNPHFPAPPILNFFILRIGRESLWKQAARSYEASFISALWMVSSESWKRLHPN